MSEQTIRTSAETKSISGALLALQAALEPAKKRAANDHFHSRYVALPDLLEVTIPAQKAAGVTLHQANRMLDGTTLRVTTRIVHAESGEWIEADNDIAVERSTPQGSTAAFTYGRRSGQRALLNLPEEDDDGNEAERESTKSRSQPAPPPQKTTPPWASLLKKDAEITAKLKALHFKTADLASLWDGTTADGGLPREACFLARVNDAIAVAEIEAAQAAGGSNGDE